ncbi:glutathione S-transferase family protein [Devosia sp. CN2-171]|uniref:glutathione S-transferase family protein n=1 Tax=Devosia sp. CN2-171 TaxID=3400909 RepID=UPI003BF83EC0
MQLYDFELSADCYKLRLMLSILGHRYDVVAVDVFPGREHEGAAFRALSPNGTVPVLDIDGTRYTDPEVTLAHLAATFGERTWLEAPELDSWLATAKRLGASAGNARLAVNFGYDHDLAALQHAAHAELRRIDEHLWFGERENRNWLAASHPTIADIACFPDIALCEEGGISRQDYPAVRRWLDRVKRIPGFMTMSGVFPTAPAL